jgi:hypothetical protein
VGAHIFTPGLLAFLDAPKVLRAATGLRSALAGALDVARFRELAELLHHVVFTLALPSHVMYDFYDRLDALSSAARAEAAPQPGAPADLADAAAADDDTRLVSVIAC